MNYFNLTQVSGGATLRLHILYEWHIGKLGSVWQVYGTACNVTTPTPTTRFKPHNVELLLLGVTKLFMLMLLQESVLIVLRLLMVLRYVRLIRANGSTNSFKLTQLAGGATLGMSYSVRVAVKYPSGVWGPFGPACMVYTQSTKSTKHHNVVLL